MIPIAAGSAWALRGFQHQTEDWLERLGLDVARAISTAADAEIRTALARLGTLALALRLDGDRGEVQQLLDRARAVAPDWLAIELLDGDRRSLVVSGDANGIDLAIEGLRILEPGNRLIGAVGHLTSRGDGQAAIALHVRTEGAQGDTHLLAAAVNPAAFQRAIQDILVPEYWVVSVADARGIRLARNRASSASLGTPFSESLMAMIANGGAEGTGLTINSEGEQVLTAYTRSPFTGWITAVGLSADRARTLSGRSFMTFGSAVLLSIIAAILASLALARSINRPMNALRESALRLGRREPLEPINTDIQEILVVAEALADAETERERFEAEREALLHQETEARTAAEAGIRAKDEFLAMLGHELRNPLGAISGASQLLAMPEAIEAQRTEAKSIISRQIAHLTRLTDDLLDASRALSGKIVLRRKALDLAALVRQSVHAMRGSGFCQARTLATDLESVWINADPIRVDQILGNLLTNAIKYTAEDGRIQVRVQADGDKAVLRVSDDGEGIPAGLVPRIFDLFVQGDRDLDRSLGGLGIGLTLVRRMAELHGATVEVHSAGAGCGSEFIVRFDAIEAPLASPTPRLEQDPGREPARGLHILIVEDNDDARSALRTLLQISGHQVSIATNGEQGLELALSQQPQVVLMDIGLPGIDGYEAARRIRAADLQQQPLLVAITGYGQPKDYQKSQLAGFDRHLTKPLSLDLLNQVLGDLDGSAGGADAQRPA